MFCRFCGSPVPDDARFCSTCGKPLDVPPASEPPRYQPGSYSGRDCAPADKPAAPPVPTVCQPQPDEPPTDCAEPSIPMKWYRFQVCFGLFAGAAIACLAAVALFLGLRYDSVMRIFYAHHKALRLLDLVMGGMLLVYGGVAIAARFKLAHFRQTAPLWLICFYVSGMAIAAVYGLIAIAIVGELLFTTRFIGDLAACVILNCILLALNAIYFKKRAFLFTK